MDQASTPLRPNQVRAHVSTRGTRSYYVVVKDSEDNWGALWFRSDASKPMHLTFGFEPRETDDVVMDNLGVIRETFVKLESSSD